MKIKMNIEILNEFQIQNSQQQQSHCIKIKSFMLSDFKQIATIDSKGIHSATNPLKSTKICTCVTAFQIQEQTYKQFSCTSCQMNLQKVNALKKNLVVVQYENAKLVQQVKQLTKQCENLKHKIKQNIDQKIRVNGESKLYLNAKDDLEAQLFECKYINKILMMKQIPKQHMQFKQKIQATLMQNLILQEQLQQKNRIIKDNVLYPIYHYDSRIKNLRDALTYFYRVANQEYKKTQQMLKMMRRQVQQFKDYARYEIQSQINKFLNDNKQNISQTHYKYNTIQTNQFPSHLKINKIQNSKIQPQQAKNQLKKRKNSKSKTKKIQRKTIKQEQVTDMRIKQEKNVRLCCVNKQKFTIN